MTSRIYMERRFMHSNFLSIFCFIHLLDPMMFSFRREDPHEEIPAINLGDSNYDDEKTRSAKLLGTTRTILPVASVEDLQNRTSSQPPPSLADDQAEQTHNESSQDDPFRFLEAEPIRNAGHARTNYESSFSPSNMSPTLRSALLSCSGSTILPTQN